MSSLISAEIAASCSALGHFDRRSQTYCANPSTLETVKDLIRYLRRDDDSYSIRRQLGETKVLETDLLPLIKSHGEETELLDVTLRLLVNLTTPALILWQEEVPTECTARSHYLEIEDHLQSYKRAFVNLEFWAVLRKRMSKILEVDFSERGDENSLIVERSLILVRNVLYVPSNPDLERRPDNDPNVHDQVLWALHHSEILDIILYVSSSITEQAYYMHILEILSFMLREQSASSLARVSLERSESAELASIRHQERLQKQHKSRIFTGARHSRFGGTYVVKSLSNIGDDELVYHKRLSGLDDLSFDADKQTSRIPKNRLPIHTESVKRRSAFSTRLVLTNFCVEFLKGAYNGLMCEARKVLVRRKAQAHDESYYLWALSFFMEFNRNCEKFEIKLVSETMSVQIFHFVQQQSETFFDMIQTDKKKVRLWSRRLHLSLLAYRELLMTLRAMDKSDDSDVKQSAKVIKSNIFYVLEYREFILTLLLTYDELKMSDSYLNDLMETQHVFLRMLQAYCKCSNVVVQAKSRSKKRGGRNKKSGAPSLKDSTPTHLDLNALWDEVAPQLLVALNAEFSTQVVPFDATSDVPIDDQKSEAMKNIQRNLRSNLLDDAVALLRTAREVWPENDSFGTNNMTPEEELLALKDVFFADLGVEFESGPMETPNHLEDDERDEEDDDEEEDDERNMQISESDFKFEEFAKRLAHPKIVRACELALKKFDKNPALTNHCIVKLLHRIAWDCKMPGMVFQVSIFRTFQRIYQQKSLPQHKELAAFANYCVKKFIEVAAVNPKVYIEALFWKNSKDAYDIENGYGASKQQSEAAAKAWTELEEDELRRLFMEHIEKNIEEDPVDWVVGNLIDSSKTRRAVLKKLKEMHLLTDYKGPRKPGIKPRIPRQWGEDEEAQLRSLFDEFKDATDIIGVIMDRLDVKRSKNAVVEKILELGLVEDKKELRKKRAKKSGERSIRNGEEFVENNSDVDSDSGSVPNSGRVSLPPRITKGSTKKIRGRKGKTPNRPAVPYGDVLKLLSDVESSGMSDALEWLRENLAEVAEDFEAEPDDSDENKIALVPVLDNICSAMEDENFLNLLRGFGILEPVFGQEQYWRIPGCLTENIRKFLNGEQEPASNTFDSEAPVTLFDDNSDDELNQNQSAPKERKKINAILDSDGEQEENVLDEDEPDESNKINGKRARFTDSDSEAPTKKKLRVLDSDSDD